MRDSDSATPEVFRPAGPQAPTGGEGSSPTPDQVFADRFLVKEVIGSGGSGTVYSALDTQVGQRVAIKVLHASVLGQASRERLRREVRASRPAHPNIVNVFDFHEYGETVFLSMELVSGTNLREELARIGSLPVDRVVDIGVQLAAALERLHEQGLVHRDVKPGNVLLADDGTIKLCDMGLARPVAQGSTVTETAMVVGTPAYMAPEQATAAERTSATDIYALGLTLYHCLTGDVPLKRETAVETLMLRQRARAPRVRGKSPGCPRWLERLIDEMLSRDSLDRPSAAAVGRALATRRHRWRPRRSILLAAGAGMILVALVAAGGWTVWQMSAGGTPANLLYTAREYLDATAFDIHDGSGEVLLSLVSDERWPDEIKRLRKSDPIAFGDIDGDGSQEIVWALASGGQGLEIWKWEGREGFVVNRSMTTRASYSHEGQGFGNFKHGDLDCADLDGDGDDEIVLVQYSLPYYPSLVRVLDGNFEVLAKIWHPGHLYGVAVGDRDASGGPELYLAGTRNFEVERPGLESSPSFVVVESDWRRAGLELDLFGPGRCLPATVPEPFRVFYIDLGKIRLPEYVASWELALRPTVAFQDLGYVEICASSMKHLVPGASVERTAALRTFSFDPQLRLVDAIWNTQLLGQLVPDPSDPELDRFMIPRYWNGTGWQTGVCAIPRY